VPEFTVEMGVAVFNGTFFHQGGAEAGQASAFFRTR